MTNALDDSSVAQKCCGTCRYWSIWPTAKDRVGQCTHAWVDVIRIMKTKGTLSDAVHIETVLCFSENPTCPCWRGKK